MIQINLKMYNNRSSNINDLDFMKCDSNTLNNEQK